MFSVRPHMFYAAMRAATVRSITLALICLPLLGLADVQNHSVEVLPHWKKGETFRLEVSRARVKSTDGKSTITGKTRTDFTIEVLSQCRWISCRLDCGRDKVRLSFSG
jgi:hypothetical protein